MKIQLFILSVILLAPLLLMQGCAPVAVTGATTAVSTVVADRRTTGAIIEDEAIENKSRLALWDRKRVEQEGPCQLHQL